MDDINKFRNTGLVKSFNGVEYVDIFDPQFQSYLQTNNLNYPQILFDDVMRGFIKSPKTDNAPQTKKNTLEDFNFKISRNLAYFDEDTPVCFRLCVENCSEKSLLLLLKSRGIPVCLASDDNVSADKWCMSKREYLIGPNPEHRMDCSYVEINTPLMRAGDAKEELWNAIQAFNSIGGYQRGLILPITPEQIVTDFSDEKLFKTDESGFLQKIAETEKLYPGFCERLTSLPSYPTVPQKSGLLYHGGRIYDDPYKIISTAPKSCIYASPSAKVASGFATSDFKNAFIQGIVHAYHRNDDVFYMGWAIEEYKPLINNLQQTQISEQQAMSVNSETPVLASHKLAEVYLKIKDHGFVKINPEQEDIKYFLQSVKTFDVDKTFAAHRIALKSNPHKCYTHFTDYAYKIQNQTSLPKDKLGILRGIVQPKKARAKKEPASLTAKRSSRDEPQR